MQYKLACGELKLFVFHLSAESEISWALGAIKGFYYVARVVHNTLKIVLFEIKLAFTSSLYY